MPTRTALAALLAASAWPRAEDLIDPAWLCVVPTAAMLAYQLASALRGRRRPAAEEDRR